jgi:hydroxymethylglutaryl-CoA lyase
MGVATGVRMAPVAETAAWLSERLDSPVQALLGRAGPFPSAP